MEFAKISHTPVSATTTTARLQVEAQTMFVRWSGLWLTLSVQKIFPPGNSSGGIVKLIGVTRQHI